MINPCTRCKHPLAKHLYGEACLEEGCLCQHWTQKQL